MNPETQYYGSPCKYGHGAAEGRCPRLRSNRRCVECHRLVSLKYREENRELSRKRSRDSERKRYALGRAWQQQPENRDRARLINRAHYHRKGWATGRRRVLAAQRTKIIEQLAELEAA